MRKVIVIISGVVIIISMIYLVTSRQYSQLDERYVSLTPGIEESVVILNIQGGDRSDIAECLNKISACEPTIVIIDLYFKNYDSASQFDKALLQGTSSNKSILSVRSNNLFATHKKFLNKSTGFGIAELNEKGGFVTDYNLYHVLFGDTIYHLAYEAALHIDRDAALYFKDSLNNQLSDVVISKLPDQLKGIKFDESFSCSQINEKVVIIGVRGPSLEDKFNTYAGFWIENRNKEEPDMYGVEIIANQLIDILNSNK